MFKQLYLNREEVTRSIHVDLAEKKIRTFKEEMGHLERVLYL